LGDRKIQRTTAQIYLPEMKLLGAAKFRKDSMLSWGPGFQVSGRRRRRKVNSPVKATAQEHTKRQI